MDVKKISYTSANSYPLKIFKNQDLMDGIHKGKIMPIHAQLIPTNRCNLTCNFCSCKERNKALELDLPQIMEILDSLKSLGCRAITITGGGEPLLHPEINEILMSCFARDISVGLVTNGILLNNLKLDALSTLTWCRISCSDERIFDGSVAVTITDSVKFTPNIGWAFSYVVTKSFDITNILNYVKFANRHKFTHIRLVSDLVDLGNAPDMEMIKEAIKQEDDSRVIYQSRKIFDPGQTNCFISLLKPVIGADGFIYPCCGAQYAHEAQDLDMADNMRLCHVKDIVKLYKGQQIFNGSQCYRCYYQNYNELLSVLLGNVEHKEFV